MGKEKIDWSKCLQAPETQLGDEAITGQMDEFIQHATRELKPLYVSGEYVAQIAAADCRIVGARYFGHLYSDDEATTPTMRAESVFVGSVAHGREDLASTAYFLLAASAPDLDKLHDDLLNRLNIAMKNERGNGGWSGCMNLEKVAKVLGRPLHQRALGSLATAMAAVRAAPYNR